MGILKRTMVASAAATAALSLVAGPVFAHQCVNASKKNQAAGVQVVIDAETDEIVWTTNGLAKRLERGLVGPDGEGFHGLVGLDFDGDGVVDISLWIGVGPEGEIPIEAQFRGPVCRGVTNIGLYFEQCLGEG